MAAGNILRLQVTCDGCCYSTGCRDWQLYEQSSTLRRFYATFCTGCCSQTEDHLHDRCTRLQLYPWYRVYFNDVISRHSRAFQSASCWSWWWPPIAPSNKTAIGVVEVSASRHYRLELSILGKRDKTLSERRFSIRVENLFIQYSS